jgi:hypothetical protein
MEDGGRNSGKQEGKGSSIVNGQPQVYAIQFSALPLSSAQSPTASGYETNAVVSAASRNSLAF